jgi:hypothetical protein
MACAAASSFGPAPGQALRGALQHVPSLNISALDVQVWSFNWLQMLSVDNNWRADAFSSKMKAREL